MRAWCVCENDPTVTQWPNLQPEDCRTRIQESGLETQPWNWRFGPKGQGTSLLPSLCTTQGGGGASVGGTRGACQCGWRSNQMIHLGPFFLQCPTRCFVAEYTRAQITPSFSTALVWEEELSLSVFPPEYYLCGFIWMSEDKKQLTAFYVCGIRCLKQNGMTTALHSVSSRPLLLSSPVKQETKMGFFQRKRKQRRTTSQSALFDHAESKNISCFHT